MLRHLFLHIHKTGGTSVVENLWKPSVPVAERHLEDDLLPEGKLSGCPNTYCEMYCLAYHHGLAFQDVFAAFWRAGKLPRECRLYSGHFGYGVHEVIGGPCRYSTVIRNPVDRTVSHFQLIKSLGHFPGDFAHYLTCDGIELANYQIKLLTGRGFCHPRRMTEGDLHEAVHNLRTQFDFCVTEHLDAFVDGMIAEYRLPTENRRLVANRTADAGQVKGSPHAQHQQFPIDPGLLPRLAELNALDVRLYEYAKRASAQRWLSGPPGTPAA